MSKSIYTQLNECRKIIGMLEGKLAETEAKLTSVLQGHRVVGIAGQVIIDLQAKLTEAERRNVAALGAMKKVAEQTWGCRGEDSDAEDCYLNNAIKDLEKGSA